MPHDPAKTTADSLIVIRLPRGEKGRYVAASRAAGLTLAAWCRATLSAAAPPVTQPGDARQDRSEPD